MPNKWRALYRRPPISGIKLTGVFYDAFKSRNQKNPMEHLILTQIDKEDI
jgi:hypothetical protein